MNKYNKSLESIEQKVTMLLEYCDALKEQNQLLLDENQNLQKLNADLKNEFLTLEEKHRILKLTRTLAEGDEKTLDIKAKINDFVREIDKCIAIISK